MICYGFKGGTGSNSSGDIFVAFSTANSGAGSPDGIASPKMLANEHMTPLFQAAAEATEEAIINALVAADTMTGVNDHRTLLQADLARTAAPHAFYNVCRHRGSRLLDSAAGSRPGPYHATEDCVHAFDRWYAQRLASALS